MYNVVNKNLRKDAQTMGLFGFNKKVAMPTPEQALPGRQQKMPVPATHYVNNNPLQPPLS